MPGLPPENAGMQTLCLKRGMAQTEYPEGPEATQNYLPTQQPRKARQVLKKHLDRQRQQLPELERRVDRMQKQQAWE